MARMVILICLLLPLLFESDSRKLSWVPDMPGNASPTATHGEGMEKEECKGVDTERCTAGRGTEAHTDYIYTQDSEP
ncbi:hypothetical protein MUK42_01181 [Musa troglodytarum]|uniref:Phytosulfokine n=1 Tax=Musa troglodytarum TaxID=320322 RepID=A0A9E7JSA2_9LILI|nr:hypothetical protein MUK42_01181 [Musa troglodytarum]